jgi:hypothetical protein
MRYINGQPLTRDLLQKYGLLAERTPADADRHTQELASAVVSLRTALDSVLEEDEQKGTQKC